MILPSCWRAASWELSPLPPSLRGSLWSHKARPTVLYLGYKWALHLSFLVPHYLICLSICPLCWEAGQSLALRPAWHGEQRHCLLPVEKRHSPSLLLSAPSAALLLLSQTSVLKGPGHFLVPEALENHPRPKWSLPLLWKGSVLHLPLLICCPNHCLVLLSKSLACLEGRDQILFIIVSTSCLA